MDSLLPNQIPLVLTEKELFELYLILKKQELQLESTVYNLLLRIEKVLYSNLTIEEMENLKNQNEIR